MTQEDKDLLLKDLCSRLPYGVKVNINGKIDVLTSVCNDDGYYFNFLEPDNSEGYSIEDIKPYLFPMSSMTEEQKKECNFADDLDSDILDAALCTNHYHRTGVPTVTYNLVDWCIKNYFDYRGLIPKGLAEDATGKNIY